MRAPRIPFRIPGARTAGASAQTVNVSAFDDSPDAFGALSLEQTVTLAGLDDTDALGAISLGLSVSVASYDDVDAFGMPSLALTLSVGAHDDPDSFGVSSLSLTVPVVSYDDVDAFGVPTIVIDQFLSLAGVDEADAFGVASLVLTVFVSGDSGVNAFGTTSPGLQLLPGGLPDGSTLGAPAIIPGEVFVSPSGLADTDAFGVHVLDQVVIVTGDLDADGFGAPTLIADQTVWTAALDDTDAFGNVTIVAGGIVNVSSLDDVDAFGVATIVPGSVTVTLAGLGNVNTFGLPQHNLMVAPSGLDEMDAFGPAVLAFDILLTGHPDADGFGAPAINIEVPVSGAYSPNAFGIPDMVPGATVLTPAGIDEPDTFGTITMCYGTLFFESPREIPFRSSSARPHPLGPWRAFPLAERHVDVYVTNGVARRHGSPSEHALADYVLKAGPKRPIDAALGDLLRDNGYQVTTN